MSFLHDQWMEAGNGLEDLSEVLERLEQTTVVIPFATRELRFCAIAEGVIPPEGKLPIHVYHKDNVFGEPGKSAISLTKMSESGVPEDILQELKLTQLLLQYNKSVFFTARYLSRDLGARAGLGGEAFDKPCESRARYLMDRYSRENKVVNAIIRKDGGIAKIIALGSRTFAHVPQTILLDLLFGFESALGKAKCIGWLVTHQITRIVVSFPEKQEDLVKTYGIKGMPTPAMLLETSDTGDCSIKCTAIWLNAKHNSLARAESYSRRHSLSTGRKDGKTLAEIAVEEAEEAVFKTYTKLPERLTALFAVDVLDPLYCIDQIADGLKLQKQIGLRRSEALLAALKASINSEEKYTAYDIAMMFLGITECEFGEDGLCAADPSITRTRLEELAYQAPFLPIEKWARSGGKIAIIA